MHCPRGVDVCFDNTSGEIADVQSGRCSTFAGGSCNAGRRPFRRGIRRPSARRRDREILVKRLRHQGFIMFDHVARFRRRRLSLPPGCGKGSLSTGKTSSTGSIVRRRRLQRFTAGRTRGKDHSGLRPKQDTSATEDGYEQCTHTRACGSRWTATWPG